MIRALLDPAGSLWFSIKCINFNVEETPDEFQNEKIWISHKLIIRALWDPAVSLWFSWKCINFNVEETPDEFQNEKIWISHKLIIRTLLDPAGSLWFSWKCISFNVEETPDQFQNEKIWISHKLIMRALLDPAGSLRIFSNRWWNSLSRALRMSREAMRVLEEVATELYYACVLCILKHWLTDGGGGREHSHK